MNLTVTIATQPPDDWDKVLLAGGGETHLLQSVYWSRVLTALDKAVPYFIRVNKGQELVGQALVMKRFDYNRNLGRKVHPLPYLECLDGPLLLEPSSGSECLVMVAENMIKLAKRTWATRLSLQPAVQASWASDPGAARILADLGFSGDPWSTYLVDLQPDEEALFNSFNRALRKNVRKCGRAGLRVVRMAGFEEYRDVFWTAYTASEKAQGRSPKPCFRATWDLDVEGYYDHFIVTDESDEVYACLGMYTFNGRAVEITSTLTPRAWEKKLPAQDLIHWEMMLAAKRRGAKVFDLAGFNPDPQTPKEEGIRRYKKKWGGSEVTYNRFHRDGLPAVSKAIAAARRVRDFFRR